MKPDTDLSHCNAGLVHIKSDVELRGQRKVNWLSIFIQQAYLSMSRGYARYTYDLSRHKVSCGK